MSRKSPPPETTRHLIDRRRVGELEKYGWYVVDPDPPFDGEYAVVMEGRLASWPARWRNGP